MTRHSVYELRTYTLHPGRRDVLIDLFERQFVESQEAVGMNVVATFRDLDRPDRFVWIRSFADMEARAEALTAFYSGPVWAAHRDAANATMIDSDNVLLLRPVGAGPRHQPDRPPPGSASIPDSLFVAAVYPLRTRGQAEPAAAWFSREVAPLWRNEGARRVVMFITEHSKNTFPRLPVRENETVLVSLMRFPDTDAYEAVRRAVECSPQWRARAEPGLRVYFSGPPEVSRLKPTARSALR